MNLVRRCMVITAVGGFAAFVVVMVAAVAGFGGADLASVGWSLALVGALLLPAALAVSWMFARGLLQDLSHVATGVDAMVRDESWGHPIAIRSRDEVGEVIRRFDDLRRHYLESLERERDARRRAEQADRDKTEFLTSVSHELRNPLNAVVGFTDVLLAEIDGPLTQEQLEDLGIIRNAGTHLVSLFNDVLDLSAAASGHLRIERRPVELGPVLQAVGAELRGQRNDRPIRIEVSVPEDLPQVCGDVIRLRQVITNLASNALKFTESGEVRLEASPDDGWVAIRVRDTGPGIAPEEVPLLFAEFGQVGDAEQRKKGTGLGLAISKELVELHGGAIDVQSTLGVGSTFTVHLPAWRAR